MKCQPLQIPDDCSEAVFQKLFSGCDQVSLNQAWLPQPHSSFSPATVWSGWADDALYLFAVLEDTDIYNPVSVNHVPAFRDGDVFEIFLRPEGQLAYSEFHVTPDNYRFQLRIPSAEAYEEQKARGGIPDAWLVKDHCITSEVYRDLAANQWSVFVQIPVDMVAESGTVKVGDRWFYSFSRYDYTRGMAEPVLSSTSDHQVLNFHRQQEWGILEFRTGGE